MNSYLADTYKTAWLSINDMVFQPNFRSDGKDFLKKSLSENARKYRRQNISVTIKLTFLSWIFECLEGAAIILVWALDFGEKSHKISGLLVPFFTLVAIPCTYILNRETTKQMIVMEDWLKGLRSTFMNAEEAQAEVARLERDYFNQVRVEQRNNRQQQNE